MEKLKICVIDDEREVVDSICENLKAVGEISGFTSGSAALEAFAAGYAPTATLVDLKMPGIGGLEFIECCQEMNVGGAIILSSGNASKNDLGRALNIGTQAFLEKPFTANEVRSAVKSVTLKAAKSLTSEERRTAEAWRNLANIYYELIVLMENSIFRENQVHLPRIEDKEKYLQLKVLERVLREKIEGLR